MRTHFYVLTGAALLALSGAFSAAQADETGLASIHTWRKVGSKTCFVDHYHDGAGTGADQKLAMSDAIRSWESFTDLEYGSDWRSFANSVSKTVTCDRGAGSISCHVSSIPCKGGATEAAPSRKPARRSR